MQMIGMLFCHLPFKIVALFRYLQWPSFLTPYSMADYIRQLMDMFWIRGLIYVIDIFVHKNFPSPPFICPMCFSHPHPQIGIAIANPRHSDILTDNTVQPNPLL